MTQNAFLGTIGYIKGNLMSNPELLDKGYRNENFYPGSTNIPNSHSSDKTMMQVAINGNLPYTIENNVVSWKGSSLKEGYFDITNFPKLYNEDGSYAFNTLELQVAYSRYDSTSNFVWTVFGFMKSNHARPSTLDTSCYIPGTGYQYMTTCRRGTTNTDTLYKVTQYKVGIKYFVNFTFDAVNKIVSARIWQEDEQGIVTQINENTLTDYEVEFQDKLVLASGHGSSSRGILYLDECWFKIK